MEKTIFKSSMATLITNVNREQQKIERTKENLNYFNDVQIKDQQITG